MVEAGEAMRADDEDGDRAAPRMETARLTPEPAPEAGVGTVVERDGERERRAVALYLQGRRAAEAASECGVSETTVRRWVARSLATLAADERSERATGLQRAIESQRAVAAAAWEAYERERELDEALLRGELDHVRRRAIRGRRAPAGEPPSAAEGDPCPPLAIEEYERPRRTAQGARYLGVALAAQREVARLEGLYARLEQSERDVRITISRRPDGPENQAPTQSDAGKARDDE